MFLIMAAAYVGQELQSEFGKIPPAFLPLGNKRLYQHQVQLAPQGCDVYISIAASYNIKESDQKWLNKNNIQIIRVPDGVSLGASLVAAINLSNCDHNESLQIVFGDTLFQELPAGDDLISISKADSGYNWAVISEEKIQSLHNLGNALGSERMVVNGYFKFSDVKLLIKLIMASSWDFIEGINNYHIEKPLLNVKSNNWLDFGHVNTYYRSKASFTTQRAFNELTINADWVEKSSTKDLKIEAEAKWFSRLPSELRIFTPQFLGYEKNNGKTKYRLEYLHQTALNELYVFGELPTGTWNQILEAALSFIKACNVKKAPRNAQLNSLDELMIGKTIIRLNEYCVEKGMSLDDKWHFNTELPVSLNQILELSDKYLPKDDNEYGMSVLHGDFCFSNILYDFRANRIKTFDPRGLTENGEISIYGDTRYDIAKLSHSVIGMYDWIVAGFFDISIHKSKIDFHIVESKQIKEVQQKFIELIEKEFEIKPETLYAMQIRLFLSMLPLHADDVRRQSGLFANAFRLHNKLKGLCK